VTDTGDIPADLYRESFLFSNRVGAPWHTLLDIDKFDRHVDAVEALGMTTVASAHATTLRGADLAEAFRLIRQIARMDAVPLPGQDDLNAILAVDQLQVA
jgi:hypothetical protein